MKQNRSGPGRLIERGLGEAIAYERGEQTGTRVTRHPITAPDAQVAPPPRYTLKRVRHIRFAMGLSQPVFAQALNVSDSTVRAWEQGKRSPEGPSLRLLELAEREPDSILRTLGSGPKLGRAGTRPRTRRQAAKVVKTRGKMKRAVKRSSGTGKTRR